jgi:putative membrane protein
MNMPMMDGAWGCGPMALMGLMGLAGLLVLGGIVAGLVWLVRRVWGGSGRPRPAAGDSPMDILRRRYAAGELTREEFDRMRREVTAPS